MRGCSFVGRPASLPVITKFVAIKGGGSFDRNVGVPTLQRHRVWAVTMYHLRVVEGDYSSNHCSKQGPIPLVRIRPLAYGDRSTVAPLGTASGINKR